MLLKSSQASQCTYHHALSASPFSLRRLHLYLLLVPPQQVSSDHLDNLLRFTPRPQHARSLIQELLLILRDYCLVVLVLERRAEDLEAGHFDDRGAVVCGERVAGLDFWAQGGGVLVEGRGRVDLSDVNWCFSCRFNDFEGCGGVGTEWGCG